MNGWSTRKVIKCQSCGVRCPHILIWGERGKSTAGTKRHLALQCVSCNADRPLNVVENMEIVGLGQDYQVRGVETAKAMQAEQMGVGA